VLIEVPVMLMLVKICLKTTHWFSRKGQQNRLKSHLDTRGDPVEGFRRNEP